MVRSILVAGGAGYIGSITVNYLVEKGIQPVVLDNLVTGHVESVDENAIFYEGDIGDDQLVREICSRHSIDSALHFAAASLVGESMKDPGKYFIDNVAKTAFFLNSLKESNVKNIVFSSTAATFGVPEQMPISEQTPQIPINPYGESKLMIEKILKEYDRAYGIKYAILRYFNACGAYGLIGEDHFPETHLIPNMIAPLLHKDRSFKIFGDDYATEDGTCVRDYIHVRDLASAHWLALKHIEKEKKSEDFNLGNGLGYSILEVVQALEKHLGRKINFQYAQRRPGDPDMLIALSDKAKKLLGWEPEHGIQEIVASAYEWHARNPKGYES